MKNRILKTFIIFVISIFYINALADSNNKNTVTKENLLSDINVSASIKRRFVEDDKISSFNIHVTTENGKVTLTGKVPDKSTKDRAISVANKTKGVKEVISKIEIDKIKLVKSLLSDSTITSLIKLKLLEDEQLSGLDIKVKTIEGKVTLTGKVPDEAAKRRAISITEVTNGVKEVISKIEIDKTSPTKNLTSDSLTTATLKLRLLQDEQLHGLDIHVQTINAKVTLTGTVPDEASHERAILVAKVTKGVKEVVSELHVKK